jgi:hypothetical protein
MKYRIQSPGLALLAMAILLASPDPLRAQTTPAGATNAPDVVSISRPLAGETQIIFHGKNGPFQIQTRDSVDPGAPWFDVVDAKVIELETGVYMALLPVAQSDAAFYRIVNENEVIAELKGWSFLVQVSTPTNHLYFAVGERPVITVSILDSFAQGIGRADLSTLNLYMYGPEDPKLAVTAVKLLNASTNRSNNNRLHHYINLKTNPDVVTNGNTLTYTLKPVTDEAPGTYTVSVRAQLGSDALQQIMKFATLQIGTNAVEHSLVVKTNAASVLVSTCAACHQGTISGKIYMHHIDPGSSPAGSWSYDFEPVRSCKSCHNNDGYASFNDASGTAVSDAIVRRVHGVHMGEKLSTDFNTNAVTGNFRDYRYVQFSADVRNCTVCHVDDRWKTEHNRLACGSCHDNIWFGPRADLPAGMKKHDGGPQTDDAMCSLCHDPDSAEGIAAVHHVPPTAFKQTVTLEKSTPANGQYYAAGEAPRLTIKIFDAATGLVYNPTNIVDPLVSTNVTLTEWKRANLLVSGPRADTVPVLTTAATNTASTAS